MLLGDNAVAAEINVVKAPRAQDISPRPRPVPGPASWGRFSPPWALFLCAREKEKYGNAIPPPRPAYLSTPAKLVIPRSGIALMTHSRRFSSSARLISFLLRRKLCVTAQAGKLSVRAGDPIEDVVTLDGGGRPAAVGVVVAAERRCLQRWTPDHPVARRSRRYAAEGNRSGALCRPRPSAARLCDPQSRNPSHGAISLRALRRCFRRCESRDRSCRQSRIFERSCSAARASGRCSRCVMPLKATMPA